jgi:putative transposase
MDKLTVCEYAELRGCSEQYVRRLIADERLAYQIADNPANKIKQYLIPISALPGDLQAKYYGSRAGKAAAGAVKQPRVLEEYSADERERIKMWSELLMDWQRYRNDPAHISKAGVDKAYVAMATLTRPELKLSEPTLYRKWAAYKAGDLDGLIDKRGQWRKGKTDMPPTLWDAFLWYYLDQRQYPISKCVEYTVMWAREYHPELVPAVPSYHAFRRHVLSIEEPVRVLARQGEKAYDDRCAPYIDRLYDGLNSNDYWVADNHTFDVLTRSADGETVHRLYLTAFIDARSQMFTGWEVTDAPCSDATLLALRRGILRCGVPRRILVDNGREFLNYDVGGLGHRQKKSTRDLPTPPPIFERLGIEMCNAIVRNAKAKPIERTFGDLKNCLSRLFATFTGGNVLEKPGNLKDVLKSGQIPLDDDLRKAVDDILDGYYNAGEYGGKVTADHGKRRVDVFNENLRTKRVATPADLTLLLMRSTRPQTIGRRGVHVDIAGTRLWFWDEDLVIHRQKEQVYVRYDPADMREVRLYDMEDRFLQTAPLDIECRLEWGASKEEIAAAQSKKNRVRKAVKTIAEDYNRLDPAERIDALDLVLRHSRLNKESLRIAEDCGIIEPVRPDEKRIMPAAVGSGGTVVEIDRERMLRNAAKRIKQN